MITEKESIKTKKPQSKKDLKFKYMIGNPTGLIKQFMSYNAPFYVKDSDFSVSVIFGGTEYFYCINPEMRKYSYLIRLVKTDFKKFAASGKELDKDIFAYNSVFVNHEFKSKKKTRKYDLNHAYWQIAYNEGIISENTFQKGLSIKAEAEELKKIYCIALSVQGSEKGYAGYLSNKRTGDSITFPEDYSLKRISEYIRNKTYYHMDMLRWKLGADFKQYTIDAIEFVDTKKNCTFVEEYFKKNNLGFKIAK